MRSWHEGNKPKKIRPRCKKPLGYSRFGHTNDEYYILHSELAPLLDDKNIKAQLKKKSNDIKVKLIFKLKVVKELRA